LVAFAIKNRKEPLSRIKRDLVVKFESDIIASLDRYLSYIFTYTRMGPLAGLYGTVVSMIAAFARMGKAGEVRVDPGKLAGDISLALWATAIGLLIATPLTLVGNMINVRIRTLEDESQEGLGRFMEDFEKSPAILRQKMAAAARQA
jgi:biopolymer transport protein ExbB